MSFFNNNGINIYYEVEGVGDPFFLINGLGGDARQWQPLIEKLKSYFQIICYDMRCAGKSDKPDKSFSIEDLANEVFSLIQHLKISKAHILGFSMGGMVTMTLAIKHPAVFKKMFLVSTTPSLKRPYPPLEATVNTFERTEVCDELLEKVYGIVFGEKFKEKVSARDFINFRMTDKNPQPAYAYLRQLEALKNCDLFDEINKIKIPSIVIVGKEDKLIPPENSIWLNNNLTDSKLYSLDGVGHMLPVEATDNLAEVVVMNR